MICSKRVLCLFASTRSGPRAPHVREPHSTTRRHTARTGSRAGAGPSPATLASATSSSPPPAPPGAARCTGGTAAETPRRRGRNSASTRAQPAPRRDHNTEERRGKKAPRRCAGAGAPPAVESGAAPAMTPGHCAARTSRVTCYADRMWSWRVPAWARLGLGGCSGWGRWGGQRAKGFRAQVGQSLAKSITDLSDKVEISGFRIQLDSKSMDERSNRVYARIGRGRAKFGRSMAESVPNPMYKVTSGPNLVEIGRCILQRALEFDLTRPSSVQISSERPKFAEFGRDLPSSVQLGPRLQTPGEH